MTATTLLALALALVPCLEAQLSTQLSIAAPPPPPVSQSSCVPVGISGGATLFYYIVARYQNGLAFPLSPVTCPNTPGLGNMTVANNVVISWSPPASQVSGYDVLVFNTAVGNPQACANCAIVLNTTSTSFTHNSNTAFAYPPAGMAVARGATATILLDNATQPLPALNILIPPNTYRNVMLSGPLTVGNTLKAAPDGAPGVVVDGGPLIPTGTLLPSGPYVTDGTVKYLMFPTLHAIAPPATGSFTFLSAQGSATATNTVGGGIYLEDFNAGGNIRLYGETKSPPYTIVADVYCGLTASQNWCGLAISDGTKFETFGPNLNAGSGRMTVATWSNSTTFVGTPFTQVSGVAAGPGGVYSPGFITLRLTDNGANRTFAYSINAGQTFNQVLSEASGTFLVPTQLGIFVLNSAGAAFMNSTWLLSCAGC